jgi:Phage integrase family
MPLRHRCEYAAALPRSLPGSSCPPPQEFPAHTRGRVRAAPGPDPPGSSRCLIKGVSHAGSSRTPLRPASRTPAIWQYWRVPALSGLLPPSPAPPGSGCPQLHRPAATGSAVKVSHPHSNHCASRRTHDLRHSTATLLLEQGVELVVIKELLGHAHIGVTATVYAHVRLRLQRDAIDLLGHALRNPSETTSQPDDGDDPPPCAAPVR